MDLLAVATKRAVPGILVFDHRKKPVFFNQGALDFLTKLSGEKSTSRGKIPRRIVPPQAISELCDSLKKSYKQALQQQPSGNVPSQLVLVPVQDTTYCCRGFFINEQQGSRKKTFHIMVLIERISQHHEIDLEKFKRQFDLTNRQMEIVMPLMTGASNKEIAGKLCISEDTIKGHFKHIMRQVGVTSRTELLSMIFQQ
jgi:DNA-binding CsgD family transcriptional regulator